MLVPLFSMIRSSITVLKPPEKIYNYRRSFLTSLQRPSVLRLLGFLEYSSLDHLLDYSIDNCGRNAVSDLCVSLAFFTT